MRNIWRLYGGWYDGNPARLKPRRTPRWPPRWPRWPAASDRLATRASSWPKRGDLRLACHLAEFAGLAAPDDVKVHRARHDVYDRRRRSELSLMARGIYDSGGPCVRRGRRTR